MAVPIRVVCANCLASVEASDGGDGPDSVYCPSCFCPIEDGSPRGELTAEISAPPESWGSPDAPTPWVRSIGMPSGGRIGRFHLGDWIGGGGYGDVYQAHDPRLDRDVAMKILKPTKLDAKATARFLREAQAAAKLNHPNIVALHEAGQDQGRLWIAYQLVKGRTLSQLRDAQTLDLRACVALVRDLALALDHAHRRGIFHRDLKPANVIVDDEGRPHLTDFGLARRLDLDSELTGEGTVLGTPAYMSPEQAAGRASAADGRSDIYSLGVILYELICGRRPSDVPSNTPFYKIERKAPPPAPQSIDRAIPYELDRICMTALALNPDDRYKDAKAFAEALDGWLRREERGRPGRLTALGLAGVAAVVIVSMLLLGFPRRGGADGLDRADVPRVSHPTNPPETERVVLKPPMAVRGDVDGGERGVSVRVNTKSSPMRIHDRNCIHARDRDSFEEFATFEAARAAHESAKPCKVCMKDKQ